WSVTGVQTCALPTFHGIDYLLAASAHRPARLSRFGGVIGVVSLRYNAARARAARRRMVLNCRLAPTIRRRAPFIREGGEVRFVIGPGAMLAPFRFPPNVRIDGRKSRIAVR